MIAAFTDHANEGPCYRSIHITLLHRYRDPDLRAPPREFVLFIGGDVDRFDLCVVNYRPR